MPIYDYECSVCKRRFEEYRSVEERREVFCCSERADKLISQVYTNPDLSYKFYTEIFGKPVYVRSGNHYRELLKKNNMPDASPAECMQHAKMRKRHRKEEDMVRVKRMAEDCVKDFKSNNVLGSAKDAVDLLVSGGKRNENQKQYIKKLKVES